MVFLLTAFLVVAADQLSKLWIRSYPEAVPIFEAGFFRIIRNHNTGAAFGLFQGYPLTLSLIALIGIVVLLLCVLFFFRHYPFLDNRLGKPALGLILGGTIGNLIDRLHLGYVVDFINIRIWPVFNIADSAIVVGTILFSYLLLSLTMAKKTDSSA